ncbi:DUF1178 family protein [Aurantimonas sp. MSK8Z-1]|uniref:DUF1178 family protein n=1 Tax=Mangrovibrevibacter kandeliae TaxID=2968473 RepID=UPI002117C1A6|nr:DUF1178 family protein [Aurantimonas sp. MSK8Z-1]MCW4116614.1 DUF1178 family protein [Aurantimonas sp. MSK8Z-1]
MIHYALRCEPAGHAFDGWFRSSSDFETQVQRGLVACTVCGSARVGKALMRPAVATRRTAAPSGAGAGHAAGPSVGAPGNPAPPASNAAASPTAPPAPVPLPVANGEVAKVFAQLQALARHVRANAENVGGRFAEEARRIHYGESEARQIYGEASPQEVEGLAEEGIAALPLPPLPEDGN